MPFKIKKAGAFSDATFVKRKSGSLLVHVSFVKVKKAGVWAQVWPLAGGTLVSINNATVSRIAGVGTEASYILNSTGIAERKEGATTSTIETWLLSGLAGDYEVRATLVSGSTPTGSALATWLPLSTTRSWSLTDAVADTTALATTLTVEIRLTSSGVVQDTATIELYSERI